MKVTILQTDTIWHDISSNISMVEKLIGDIDLDTDLIVLPEMFNTGFSMTPEMFSDQEFLETVSYIKKWSSDAKALICGSLIRKHNNGYFNSFFWADSTGNIAYYNKRHLFNMAGEGEHYQSGVERKTFMCGSCNIMPQVCYDLRFPIFSRNDMNYDCLIYVANWPLPRIEAWKTLLKARAIENQCFVIGVNRVGQDENNNEYSGQSMIIDYAGNALYHAGNKVSVGGCTIDLDPMYTFREKLPFLKDKDQFSIKY